MLSYNSLAPGEYQTRDWTCSACSLAWLNRALSIDHATDEFSAVEYIGEPEHINADYGLMDASGARLAECLREQGAPAFTFWTDWNDIYELCREMPALLGGVAWNHWVGVRQAGNDVLYLANSAPGWMGVDQELDFAHFDALGPWAAVPVPLLTRFPPPPTA